MQQRCCKWRPKGHRRRELRVTQRDEVTDTIRTHVLKSTVAISVGGLANCTTSFKLCFEQHTGWRWYEHMGWVGVEIEWTIDQDVKRQKLSGPCLGFLILEFLESWVDISQIFSFLRVTMALSFCLEDEHNLVKTVWDLTCTPSEKMAPKLGENFWKFHPD